MGLFDRFRRTTALDSASVDTPDFYGAWRLSSEEYLRILGLSPGEMWRTQPYLRIVVNFMARNIAQLGLHTFQRVSESDRQRLRDGGMVEALRAPNRATTPYELVYGLVADLALYDVAYWMLSDDPTQMIVRLPVPWTKPKGGDALGPDWYEVRKDDAGQAVKVPADQILAFHGWHPDALTTGSSPINALKEILAEQVEAARYRTQVWQRGGKVGAVLSRPAGAQWSDEARKQFKKDWKAKFSGDGPEVGGTPILEDGMTLQRVDFNAHEMEFTEGARLALNTIASAYHIPPPMIGILDNANYSNVREFRKAMYGDTLGPVIAQIEDRINSFLVPRLDPRPGVYVEFNIAEKLQGSFEEQATAFQSAVGRPWMEPNEARARTNLPALPEGNGLALPLNVLIGGQASPTDSGSQNVNPSAPTHDAEPKTSEAQTKAVGRPSIKAAATQPQQDKIAEVLAGFFERQGKSVLSRLGAGDSDWWDGTRWDKELSSDLFKVSHTIAADLGAEAAKQFGFPDGFSPDGTVHFLQAVTARYAGNINATTKAQAEAARDDPDAEPAATFDQAKGTRARGIAVGVGTFVAAFATVDAARQIALANNVKPTKTWITGPNPRTEHAAMNGETVPIDQEFSNGLDWPGSGGDADEVAGCNCTVEVSV
jgi:HK97 family phage portal protein